MWEMLKGEGIPQFLTAILSAALIMLDFLRIRRAKSRLDSK